MQTLESSLIFTKEDKTQAFVHDTYLEFFLAKSFAQKINSGKLPVKDAYERFWSFEVDEDSFGVGGRSILPAWHPTIKYLSEMLGESHARELTNVLTSSFFEAKNKMKSYEVNPFNDDLILFADCCNSLQIKNKRLRERTVTSLLKAYDDFPNIIKGALIAIGGEEVSKRIVTDYYSNFFFSRGLDDDLLYMLCRIDKRKTREYFKKTLHQFLRGLSIDEIVNITRDELEFDSGHYEIEKIMIKTLIGYFEIIKDGMPKKDFFEFYEGLLNDLDERFTKFVKIVLYTPEKDEPTFWTQKSTQPTKERLPDRQHLEERKKSLFPQLDGDYWNWRIAPFPDYNRTLSDNISNQELIQNFQNSQGYGQARAAFLIKNRSIKEAEPICINKLQKGSLKEKIYSAWTLSYIGSIKAIPYLLRLLHQLHPRRKADEYWLHRFTREALIDIVERNTPEGYNPPVKKLGS